MPVGCIVDVVLFTNLHKNPFFQHAHRDIGVVDPRHDEPFVKLLPQGMVTGQSFKIKATGQYISPKDAVLDDDQKMVRVVCNWWR